MLKFYPIHRNYCQMKLIRQHHPGLRLFLLLIIIGLLSSCSSIHNAQQYLQDKSHCIQQADFNYTEADMPKSFHSLTIDTLLINRVSLKSLNTANAIGVLDLMDKYVREIESFKKDSSLQRQINLMDLSQRISKKIDIASLEISAVASELDCEEERADQFAYFLKEREGTIEKNLIIASTIVGAVGTLGAELLANSDNGAAASVVAVGASLIETAFGILMLTNKKKIDFYHPINPLTDIWNAPKVSTYYPPSIWYYLTYQAPLSKDENLLKSLKDKWMLFGQVAGKKDKNREQVYELYFGKGGKYTSEQLKNRADMMDQVEAYITLMKQNLRSLSVEVDALRD